MKNGVPTTLVSSHRAYTRGTGYWPCRDAITRASAEDIYGVLIEEAAATVDPARTRELRARLRRQRVQQHGQPRRLMTGQVSMRVTENMNIVEQHGVAYYACVKCGGELGSVASNYKSCCIREDRSVKHAVPLSGDPARFIDDKPVFRQFFCPTCGALIENEVAMETDPLLHDIHLDPATIGSVGQGDATAVGLRDAVAPA